MHPFAQINWLMNYLYFDWNVQSEFACNRDWEWNDIINEGAEKYSTLVHPRCSWFLTNRDKFIGRKVEKYVSMLWDWNEIIDCNRDWEWNEIIDEGAERYSTIVHPWCNWFLTHWHKLIGEGAEKTSTSVHPMRDWLNTDLSVEEQKSNNLF